MGFYEKQLYVEKGRWREPERDGQQGKEGEQESEEGGRKKNEEDDEEDDEEEGKESRKGVTHIGEGGKAEKQSGGWPVTKSSAV